MTKKEQIYRHLLANCFETSPSVRELGEIFHIKSTSTVFNILHSLEDDGLIDLGKGKRRNITIVGRKNVKAIPLLKAIAKDKPILDDENIDDWISFAVKDKNDEMFALKVKDDSMKNAGIEIGDTIIVKCQQSVDDGDIVVAVVDDEIFCRRIKYKVKFIDLLPENPKYAPMETEIFSLLGKVVSLSRDFE